MFADFEGIIATTPVGCRHNKFRDVFKPSIVWIDEAGRSTDLPTSSLLRRSTLNCSSSLETLHKSDLTSQVAAFFLLSAPFVGVRCLCHWVVFLRIGVRQLDGLLDGLLSFLREFGHLTCGALGWGVWCLKDLVLEELIEVFGW